MPRYTKFEAVQIRLQGKIKFTDDPEENPNRMGMQLAKHLICEAEAQVEVDLSTRYAIPFQTIKGEPYSALPIHTKLVISGMCVVMSAIRILETDFGRGGAISSDDYMSDLEERYNSWLKKLVLVKKNSYNTWAYPPLDGLKNSYFQKSTDSGFMGQIYVDSKFGNDFAANRVHDPSQSFHLADLWGNDDLDGLI